MTTSPTRPDATAGPARFERHTPEARRSPLESLLAGLALLLLVVGVPVALLALGGAPPLPSGDLPDLQTFVRSVGPEQVITVLVGVVWLAWLHFVGCVVVEVVAALRGGVLAPSVPLGGGSQRLARALVAALLLSTALATHASAAVPLTSGATGASTVVAEASAAPAPGSTSVTRARAVDSSAGTHSPDTPDESNSADVQARAAFADSALWGQKVYTVDPPQGRHHDSLWDIAERHLGDGRRYHEIYALNADRLQPDGRALHLARLIQPGWNLVMPQDAVGVRRWEAPETVVLSPGAGHGIAGVDDEAGSGPADVGAMGGAADSGIDDAADSGIDDAADADAGRDGGDAAPSPSARNEPSALAAFDPLSLAGATLLAVGLVSALRRSRRRARNAAPSVASEACETEVWLRIEADPLRAQGLTRALASLTAACLESGRSVPQVYAVSVDHEGVDLFLAPPQLTAPPPWSAIDDGYCWRVDHVAVPAQADASSPCPALVSIGRDLDGRDVLVNLAAAAGVVSLDGSAVLAGQVARALAVELATNTWSGRVRVIGVDLPAELDALAAPRLTLVDSVDDALRVVTGARSRPDDTGAPAGPGGTGAWSGPDVVVSGRREAADDRVDVIVLGRSPTEGEAESLLTVAQAAGGSVAVLAPGPVAGARWAFVVDDAGSLHVDALGVTVTASRIDDRTLASIETLFVAASAGDSEGAVSSRMRPEIPTPPAGSTDAMWVQSQVRVGILGPVLVRGPGAVDVARVDLLTELVAVFAAHPLGVHRNVLAGAVWPRGVTSEVRDGAIARARDWLGVDQYGQHRIQHDQLGLLSLSGDVPTDWHVFCALATEARLAVGTARERDSLVRALRLVRGPLMAGVPEGRYAWLARTGLEVTVPAVIVDAAHRLVELTYQDDPVAAAEAARGGLRGHPCSQMLWRDLLWSEHAIGGADAVRAAAATMTDVLRGLEVEIEAETSALLEELAPGGPSAALGG